jgi:putative transcriptional regulator
VELDTFGVRLRAARKSQGLTLQALADAIGQTRQAIWKLENGVSQPSWDTACQLAKALAVPLDALRASPHQHQ